MWHKFCFRLHWWFVNSQSDGRRERCSSTATFYSPVTIRLVVNKINVILVFLPSPFWKCHRQRSNTSITGYGSCYLWYFCRFFTNETTRISAIDKLLKKIYTTLYWALPELLCKGKKNGPISLHLTQLQAFHGIKKKLSRVTLCFNPFRMHHTWCIQCRSWWNFATICF